jgi:hypothetical protein
MANKDRSITIATIEGTDSYKVRIKARFEEGYNTMERRFPKGYVIQFTVFRASGGFETMELGSCSFSFYLMTTERYNAKKLASLANIENVISGGVDSWLRLLQRNANKGLPTWEKVVDQLRTHELSPA